MPNVLTKIDELLAAQRTKSNVPVARSSNGSLTTDLNIPENDESVEINPCSQAMVSIHILAKYVIINLLIFIK